MKEYVLGIDGGGSKTEALLVEIGTGRQIPLNSGGINSITDGMEVAYRELQTLITNILAVMSKEKGQILSICLGSADIINEALDSWSSKVLSDAFPDARIHCFMDSRIALEGALNGQPGIIIVAGTGSIAHSIDADHVVKDCGGWGPCFGDEGSGYAMGCEALRSVAMDLDGRGEPTQLTENLKSLLQIRNGYELIDKVYSKMGRKEIASLSVAVAQCALNGDLVALRILDDASKHFAHHLLTLYRKTVWEAPPIFSYAGGVFRMGDVLLNRLRHHLGEYASLLKEPSFSPSYGAVILAMKELSSKSI